MVNTLSGSVSALIRIMIITGKIIMIISIQS